MSRYFVNSDWRDDRPLLPDVRASDHEPVKTGVLDQLGRPIMRAPHPMGFHAPKSRA